MLLIIISRLHWTKLLNLGVSKSKGSKCECKIREKQWKWTITVLFTNESPTAVVFLITLLNRYSKDVRLPVQLQRAMAAEAEAAREARAKVCPGASTNKPMTNNQYLREKKEGENVFVWFFSSCKSLFPIIFQSFFFFLLQIFRSLFTSFFKPGKLLGSSYYVMKNRLVF